MHHEVPPAAMPAAFDVGLDQSCNVSCQWHPSVPGESHHLVPPPRLGRRNRPCGLCRGGLRRAHLPAFGNALPGADAPVRQPGRLRARPAKEWARKLAPCGSCRVDFEAQRSALRGVRLGQREREVLLGAAGADIYIVTETGMSRSLSAARRRAAQSLMKAGLVSPTTDNPDGTGTRRFPISVSCGLRCR